MSNNIQTHKKTVTNEDLELKNLSEQIAREKENHEILDFLIELTKKRFPQSKDKFDETY